MFHQKKSNDFQKILSTLSIYCLYYSNIKVTALIVMILLNMKMMWVIFFKHCFLCGMLLLAIAKGYCVYISVALKEKRMHKHGRKIIEIESLKNYTQSDDMSLKLPKKYRDFKVSA